jgi:hypothetical protein
MSLLPSSGRTVFQILYLRPAYFFLRIDFVVITISIEKACAQEIVSKSLHDVQIAPPWRGYLSQERTAAVLASTVVSLR